MNRRGFVGDLATVLVVLFVLVVTIVTMAFVFGSINDKFQASSGLSNTTKDITNTLEGRYVGVWDGIAMMVFAFLSVALIISVASIGTRPEFFFLLVIVAIILVGVAAIFANTYESLTGTSLNAVSAEFVFIPLLMSNLVEVVLFLVALLAIGLFVKLQGVV